MSDNNLLIGFLQGVNSDYRGRTIDSILRFSENDIENNHDFIQWIFPTKERSLYNKDAPIIDDKFCELLESNAIAQQNFCKSCNLFLNFIGFNCDRKGEDIYRINNSRMFYDRPTHNLLRITRVLNSLNQIGKSACSNKLFRQLKELHDLHIALIPSTSFSFWEATQK
jgi:hypothetical protein